MKSSMFFLVLLTLLLKCEGCLKFIEEEEPETELEKLPPATQEGKNTFGCLVDGKAWVAKTSIDASSFYQEGILSIMMADSKGAFIIYILDENLAEREYHLPTQVTEYVKNAAEYFSFSEKNCDNYITIDDHTGTLKITYLNQQWGKWIISGTFEFEGYSDKCQKTIKITDGRFDLNYTP
jgi:hypothetical protein